MKDSLKEFVDNNRQAFDHLEPSNSSWNKIERNVPGKSRSLWNNVNVWRVAAMLFLGLSIYLFTASSIPNKPSRETAKLQGEFSDLENFYSEQIAEKVELINTIQNFNEEEEFTQDMEKVEAMYFVLREQMKINPTEKVKDALILNLLIRMDLLNQQIESLEDSKKEKSQRESAASV
jgi:ABC-type multidrug transport system fused ATPase/permease subunit